MNEHAGFVDCPVCDGSGVVVFAISVHEPGCGYSHESADEKRCGACNGTGREWAACEPAGEEWTEMEEALDADREKLRQMGVES